MIIYRALVRESARNTLAIAVVLTVIMGFVGLSVWLGRAVHGDVGQNVVMELLGLEALRRLDLLLTLSLYLGVLFTLSRWYRDNEMAVLAACGVGLGQLLRPALGLALAVAAVVALLGCVVNPWAAGRMDLLKIVGQRQATLIDTAPGVFNSAGPDARVYFAERVDDRSGVSENVFLAGPREGRSAVSVARRALPWADPQSSDRYILLEEGASYEGTPGDADYRLTRFDKLYVWLKPAAAVQPAPRSESADLRTLVAQTDRSAKAELHWRIAKPFTAVVLVLFAFILAYTDPRRGRMSGFFSAVFVYFIYSNVLAYGDLLLKRGRVPPDTGLWWVHISMFAIALYFFYRRANNRPLFGRLRGGR